MIQILSHSVSVITIVYSAGAEVEGSFQDQSLCHTRRVPPGVLEKVHREQGGEVCQLLDHRLHSQRPRPRRQRSFQGHFNLWCHCWFPTRLWPTKLQPVTPWYAYAEHTSLKCWRCIMNTTCTIRATSSFFSLLHNKSRTKGMIVDIV